MKQTTTHKTQLVLDSSADKQNRNNWKHTLGLFGQNDLQTDFAESANSASTNKRKTTDNSRFCKFCLQIFLPEQA